MSKINSTQRATYSLNDEECQLIDTFRKIDDDDKGFILAMTARSASRTVKTNPLRLVSETQKSAATDGNLNRQQTDLLQAFGQLDDRLQKVLTTFAQGQAKRHGKKPPSLRSIQGGRTA